MNQQFVAIDRKRNISVTSPHIKRSDWAMHRMRVRLEMQRAGASPYVLNNMEGRYLPSIIHIDEHVQGIVFGYQEVGFAMLVATDKRVIFLDKKPMFVNEDEVTYNVVSGVVYNNTVLGTTLTLHTRVKDYKVFTFNRKCVQTFVHYIELRCLENPEEGGAVYDQVT